MRSRNRRRPTRSTLAIAVVTALAIAGCDGDQTTPPASSVGSTSTSSSTTTTLLSTEEAAVFEAYRSCWTSYIEFGSETSRSFTRADFDARVGGCLVRDGELYRNLLRAFSNNRPAGVYFRGPAVEHDPTPDVAVTGTTATVRDCMLDRGEVYDADDGRVLDPASGNRTLNIVELDQVGNAWRLRDANEGGQCTE